MFWIIDEFFSALGQVKKLTNNFEPIINNVYQLNSLLSNFRRVNKFRSEIKRNCRDNLIE